MLIRYGTCKSTKIVWFISKVEFKSQIDLKRVGKTQVVGDYSCDWHKTIKTNVTITQVAQHIYIKQATKNVIWQPAYCWQFKLMYEMLPDPNNEGSDWITGIKTFGWSGGLYVSPPPAGISSRGGGVESFFPLSAISVQNNTSLMELFCDWKPKQS